MEWSVFIKFMLEIDRLIATSDTKDQKRLAAMQTIIAAGAYMGLETLELLAMTWDKIHRTKTFSFSYERHRPPTEFPEPVVKVIDKNYQIIQPASLSQRVISDMTISEVHDNFKSLLEQSNIKVADPVIGLLRRTYIRKIWADHGKAQSALDRLSVELKMSQQKLKGYIQ